MAGRCQPAVAPHMCSTDEECADDEFCDVGTCKKVQYVACASDLGCPSGLRCDVARMVCLPSSPTACASDAGCSGGQVCEASLCVPGCAEPNPTVVCGANEKCNGTTGRCEVDVPRCASDSSCGAPQGVCESGACVPGCAEVGGLACATGESCNAVTGRCEPSGPPRCGTDAECGPPAEICEAEVCVPGCQVPGGTPCGASESCVATTGRCEPTPTCSSDSQCGAPARICISNACVPGCGRPGATACSIGTTCDAGSGRCVDATPPCSSDSECSPPTICELNECAPGCAAGGPACAANQSCDANTGRCLDLGPLCINDLECNSPATICGASLRCEPGCEATGCAAPESCSTETGHCSDVTCPADAYEPNETPPEALALIPGAYSFLTSCPGDVDYFGWVAEPGDAMSIAVVYGVAEGDIDATLYDPQGLEVASGRTRDDDDTLDFVAQSVGAYLLAVQSFRDLGPLPGNAYDLELGVVCAPDVLEPNDTEISPAPLPVGAAPRLRLCSGDEDWLTIDATAGYDVMLTATFSDAEGDIDLELFDAAGDLLASSEGVSDSEVVAAVGPGPFLAHVLLYSDDGVAIGNRYDLDLVVTPPPCGSDAECGAPTNVCEASACVPGCGQPGSPLACGLGQLCDASSGRCVADPCFDRFEDNDTSSTAHALNASAEPSLTICSADDDWYAISVAAGQTVSVVTSFTDAEGDVDLELYDPTGTRAIGSYGVSDGESLALVADQTGTWMARVSLYQDEGSTGNVYDLSVTIDESCPADQYEPNDLASPAFASFGVSRYLSLCPSDDDYYDIYLFTGETLTVTIEFSHAEGDLDMVLLDDAGNQITTSAGVTDSETVTYTALADGLVSVGVFLYSDNGSRPGNLYTMTINY